MWPFRIAKKCKNIQIKSHEIADDYYAVATQIQTLGDLLKPTEIPQISYFYKRLQELVSQNGDFILQSGELMNNNLNGWFKYHREESKSFKEAFYLRNESKIIYQKWKKELDMEKERLFKSQDFGQWKTRPEDVE